MKTEVHIVNAFTLNGGGGNPAGVVLDATGLDARQMQAIATRLALSETAFVCPSEEADMEVRFFTPTSEIDFCGHAIVATFATLRQNGLLQKSSFQLKTRLGNLPVVLGDDGEVSMHQALPVFGDCLDAARVSDILGIAAEEIRAPRLPIQIVSTGLRDVMVALRDESVLARIKPDFDAMARFNRESDSVGFHVFALAEPGSPVTARCRNFAPLFGIEEESATGSSAGALACYLNQHLDPRQLAYQFEQGHGMGRPSRLSARISRLSDRISSVVVGGCARIVESKILDR